MDFYSKPQIKEAKKMWRVEFELNENKPIQIGNNFYGSGEVGQLLDRINDPQIYDFELRIFKCFELLFFLTEENEQPFDALPELEPAYYEKDFIRYISPLLAPRFSEELKTYLVPYRASMLKKLFTFYNLMTEEDLRIPMFKINTVINKIFGRVYDCKHEYKTTGKIPKHKIYSSLDSWDIVLLNALPPMFQPKMNELALLIIELYEGVKANPDSTLFSKQFIQKAFVLNISKELKDRLEKEILT